MAPIYTRQLWSRIIFGIQPINMLEFTHDILEGSFRKQWSGDWKTKTIFKLDDVYRIQLDERTPPRTGSSCPWRHRPSLPRFLFSWIFVFGQKGHFTLLLLDWKRVSPRESVWPTLSLPSFSFLPPPPHNHSGLSSGRYFYVSQCQQEGLFDFLAFRRDGIITKVGQSDF